ncbi:GTPase HflX [bacterium]|nr:GTPase HflX [bacterium]
MDTAPLVEQVLLVCPTARRAPRGGISSVNRSSDGRVEEAIGLVNAAGLDVAHAEPCNLASVSPSHYIGQGKVDELKQIVDEQGITLAVMDCALSPVQQRNLENAWKCKVIDRTALIIEIFGQRARTREGQLQVELASLDYQKGRLVRAWSHLERQRGGGGFTGGPGERQLELDKRIIRDRIIKLKKELQEVRQTRELHRKKRREAPYPVVALVGYTNAGKSTLFNRLTGAEVLAQDKLFATLDPTLRKLKLPSGVDIMLSDTVGFISNLPTQLVEAFRATLEEVLEATLILHVRDISHEETDIQKLDVEKVLKTLDLSTEALDSMLECWNKMDVLDEEQQADMLRLAADELRTVCISAHTGEGLDRLTAAIDEALSSNTVTMSVELHPDEGGISAWLHENAHVMEQQQAESNLRLSIRITPANQGRLLKKLKAA